MRYKKHNDKTRRQYLLLAALTHELTGEEEFDIYSYLAKHGVSGFYTRIDTTDLPPKLKQKLNELHAYIVNCEGVCSDVHA